jgi:hypothetical protein
VAFKSSAPAARPETPARSPFTINREGEWLLIGERPTQVLSALVLTRFPFTRAEKKWRARLTSVTPTRKLARLTVLNPKRKEVTIRNALIRKALGVNVALKLHSCESRMNTPYYQRWCTRFRVAHHSSCCNTVSVYRKHECSVFRHGDSLRSAPGLGSKPCASRAGHAEGELLSQAHPSGRHLLRFELPAPKERALAVSFLHPQTRRHPGTRPDGG